MALGMVKHIKLPLALIMTLTIAGSSTAANNPLTIYYQNSSEDLPNPERGFSTGYYSENVGAPLPLDYLQNARSNNITLIHAIYNIPNYRNSDLPPSFLNLVAKNCETARKAGVKLFIRFTYNQGQNQLDAPKNIILRHLDQLKPILKANYDVIAFMDAGFIGAWGEWHHSSNGLNNIQDKKTILFKLLSVLPSKRMVVLRYLRDKTAVFSNLNPLISQEAFNGSYRARTGAHNDCLAANADDWATYRSSEGLTSSNIVESQKNFLNLDNRYVVQGGETCQPSTYADCPNALKELERMHWSQLNSVADKTVLQGWKDQGCIKEIKHRLGYRFRLINSIIPVNVKPAGTFSMSFNVTNDGWASPYNPRSLEVILRNTQTGKEYYLPVAEAVRMWMPGATKTVNIVGGIPTNMPLGEYRVFLNLPDPTPRLYGRPQYSIRLANQDIWEPPTGYNSLLKRVIVDPSVGGDTYPGSKFFKSR